jgi:hypothetical protein
MSILEIYVISQIRVASPLNYEPSLVSIKLCLKLLSAVTGKCPEMIARQYLPVVGSFSREKIIISYLSF